MSPNGSHAHPQHLRSRRASWARHAICLIGLIIALEAMHRIGVDWREWKSTVRYNPQFQEGWAWRHGRLDLRYPLFDAAYLPDPMKSFNVYPPLQSIVGFVLTVPFDRDGPMPELGLASFLLFALPLPFAGYWAFYRRTSSSGWAAILTLGWIGGTAVLPCLVAARNDDFHHVNHLLSQVGLLVLAAEALGRRRIGVLLVALMICAWTRQLAGLFAIAVVYVVATKPADEEPPATASRRDWRRIAGVMLGLAVVVGVPMALNWGKFGSPLRTGYELIYREDDERQAAKNVREHGLFSHHFAATNAYYMNVATPWGRNDAGRVAWKPPADGGSLWLGTPLTILVWLGAAGWWRDKAARAMMLCSLPIVAGHLFYHNTGFQQHGYYRFSLDYLPVWLIVGAPWLTTGWRRWATAACIAWSLGYFAMVRYWAAPGAI